MLISDFATLPEWFHDNHMILNPGKCSYMWLGKNNNDNDTFSFNEFKLKNSKGETILGIKTYRKLTLSAILKL